MARSASIRLAHRSLATALLAATAASANAATITWDGGGGNLNWLTAANWSGDVLPGPGDDVVIDATGSVTIVLAGNATVNSLTCADALTINNAGTLTVAGSANVTGLVTLANGKLVGGTWTPAAGIAAATADLNRLEGVTVNGNINTPGATRLHLRSGLTLNGTLLMTGANPRVVVENTMTISGSAMLQLDGSNFNPARLNVEGTSTLTLGPTVLIEGGWTELGQSVQSGGVSAIINKGVIRCDTTNSNFDILGEQFINEGTVESTLGTLNIAATQAWANDGLIRALTNGAVNLAGSVAPADLGDVRNVSGTVRVQTALALAGGTLTLDAVTGVWTFDGANISNGTLNINAGGAPTFTSNNTIFDGLTVNGNVTMGGGQWLRLKNGLTLNGTLSMTGANARLVVDGTQSISGSATLQLDGTNFNPARINVEGTSILTIASTVLFEGGWAELGNSVQSAGVSGIVNNGTIRCDTANAQFEIFGEQFTNNGTVEATAGLLRIGSTAWTNSSTMKSLGGTLRLEGSTTIASYAGITNGGGAVQIASSLDFAGASLTLTPANGTFTFDGGTWKNGTITVQPGATPIFTGGNTTFEAMTVNGTLTMGSSQWLRLKGGLTLNGTLSMTGTNARLVVDGTQSIQGSATLQLHGTNFNPARINVEGTSILTLASTVLIEGGWAELGNHAQTAGVSGIVNNGTIRCDTANAQFDIFGEQFTNNSTIESIAGTLTIGATQNWTNAGLMRALTTGTLSLSGVTSASGIGDVRNVSGTVLFKTVADLLGGTLTLNATTGVWTFDGGTLKNGTLAILPGGFPTFTSGNTIFEAMTISGNVTMGSSQWLRIKGGLTLNGTLSMTGTNARLVVDGTQSIQGSATLQLHGTNFNPARINVEGTSILTLASTVLIEGGWAELGSHTQTGGVSGIVNNGTIRCDTANAQFDILGEQFTNSSTVESIAGTLTIGANQNWTNAGLMRALTTGTLSLSGVTSASGIGDVRNVSGTVLFKTVADLLGGTLTLNATTGVWTFDGGTLKNGTLAPSAGGFPTFTSGNTIFEAMTISGNVTMGGSQWLRIKGGLTLNGTLALTGANPRLVLDGTQTIGGNATILLDGSSFNPARINVEGASVVTFASTVLIEGGWAELGNHIQTAGTSSIVNNGVMRADTASASFHITGSAGDTFTNNGTVETSNSNTVIVENATNLAAGTLSGGVWKATNAILRFGTVAVGAPITTLAAECVLTGRNGKILDLAKLETIATTGVLRLNDGAILTAVPASGTLVDNGFLFLNGTSKLNVTGGFTHTATAILTVATGAANQILVDASAALNLDGFLQVSNGPGYTPTAGDQIVIADGTSRVGEFDTLTTCELADLFYTPTQAIYVYGEDTGVFADLNGDGFVGAPDLALLLGSWGPCSDLCCNADLDLSGDVGAPDIALLLGGWG